MRSKQVSIRNPRCNPHRHRDVFMSLLDDDERRHMGASVLDVLDENDDREQHGIRIGALDVGQALTMGLMVFGLDATPTGTDAANDVVADFTGASAVLFDHPSVALPVVHSPSQTLGSTFHPVIEGQWVAIGKVHAITAATVRAGAGFGNNAGDLAIDPAYSSRTLDVSLRTAIAADVDPVVVDTGPMIVTRAMALDATLGLFRLLLSNGAGAGAVAGTLNLPLCKFSVLRIGNIPRASSSG